jgi:hypothetical protein
VINQRGEIMDQTELEELYGPPVLTAPHAIGATLVYQDGDGTLDNGPVLYVAAGGQDGPYYVVSPATTGFPSPVWPRQIITAM